MLGFLWFFFPRPTGCNPELFLRFKKNSGKNLRNTMLSAGDMPRRIKTTTDKQLLLRKPSLPAAPSAACKCWPEAKCSQLGDVGQKSMMK